ncbi:MAG: hypothetical protein ACQEP6_00680 [Patescibacteria group bacterium]
MKKKIIYSSLAVLVILVAFSITGTALGERIDFSELPGPMQAFMGEVIALNPAGPGEAPRYYDLLIKKVKTGSGSGAYRAGDIVTAREYGSKWSSAEKNNFWIVKMYLTEAQVQELLSPQTEPIPEEEKKEMDEEFLDEEEERMTARRKYYIPPEALEQLKEGGMISKGYVKEREK